MTGVHWAMLRMETCREQAHGGVSETNENAKFTGQQYRGPPGGVTEICEGRNIPYRTQKEHRFGDALIVDLQSLEMRDREGLSFAGPQLVMLTTATPGNQLILAFSHINDDNTGSDKDNTK